MSNGLGRRPAPDPKDERHLIRGLLAAAPSVPTKSYAYYVGSMFLDQGNKPQCVEYSWHHYVQTGRIRPKGKWPYWQYGEPYAEMQRIDEWPGENYDGTSVRAGAKVMQARGYIDSYLWSWDINETINAVLTLGPVVVGTNWYTSMFDVEHKVIKVEGSVAGGHAWLIDGVNTKQALFRAKNSWSRKWGFNGRFWISFEDMERLINEQGEVCLAVEHRP